MGSKTGMLGLAIALASALPALADGATFSLESSTVSGGDAVKLTFNAPLAEANARYWIALVKAGEADSAYGVWDYVDAGAVEAELIAPEIDGDYEVRLHGNYPDKSYHVLHREALKITGLTPTKPEDIGLVVPKQNPVDETIAITFKTPLVPEAEEKFWVCVVPAGAEDTNQGLWTMVPAGAESIEVPAASSSGDHEVRLHGNYPTQTTNVVARAPVQITGAEDTLPTDNATVEATLAAASIALGDAPVVNFNIPLRPRTGEKFWIGVVHADLPESASGLWTTLSPGDSTVTLSAPICTGKHRITLHANYPTQSQNPIAVLELEVTGDGAPTDTSAIELTLDAQTIKVGEQATVSFNTPLRAKTGERFWVTLIPADAADSEWGQYSYLEVAAGKVELAAPEAAGAYEVRLHANYPTESANVVARTTLKVE